MRFSEKLATFFLKPVDWYARYCAWVWRIPSEKPTVKHFVESPPRLKTYYVGKKASIRDYNSPKRKQIYSLRYQKTDARPSPLPYHLEKGWGKRGRAYHGYYRCRLGAFRGEIEERFNGEYKFYIFDPPQQVLNGFHKACFTNNGGNRYHVHFAVNAENLDSGIMAMERVLYESLNRR